MKAQPIKFVKSAAGKAGVSAVLLVTNAIAFAQETVPATPEAAIGDGQTKILALIAVAGAAYIAIALASTGWEVGAKLIKRLRGKA